MRTVVGAPRRGSVEEGVSLRGIRRMRREASVDEAWDKVFFFFFFTLVTGPRRSFSLKLSDKRVYEPQIRARLCRRGVGQGLLLCDVRA